MHTVKKNRILYLLWAMSLFSIAISVITTRFLTVIPLALFCVATLFFSSEELLCFLIGLLPFANIFKLSPGSMSLFTVCEMIAVLFLVMRVKIRFSWLISTLILAAYMLALSFDNLNILTIVKVIVGFILIGSAVSIYTRKGIVKSARLLSLSTIIMLLLSSNNKYLAYVEPYFNDLDYLIDSTGHATETLRISGFMGDPNYCSVLIIMVLSLLCVLYYYKSIGVEFWVYTAFLVPLGFLTYSKSYILCVALFIVMLILFVLLPKHKVWALIAFLGAGVAAFLVVNGKIPVINTILERFELGDITTGRLGLNMEYLKYISENTKVLLFGEGVSVEMFAGSNNNVHNIYIELLFKFGIIGSLVYIVTLVASLRQGNLSLNKAKRGFASYIPLAFFLLMFAFLAGVNNYALPFYIIIAYLGLNFNRLPSGEKEPVAVDD